VPHAIVKLFFLSSPLFPYFIRRDFRGKLDSSRLGEDTEYTVWFKEITVVFFASYFHSRNLQNNFKHQTAIVPLWISLLT